jgi:putative toxin-antitoxin system antitoxin component (TIGR02293 family)
MIVKEYQEVKQFYLIFSKYEKSISDPIAIVTAANKGITAAAFFDFANLCGIEKDKLADLLNTSLKTLTRYKQAGKKLNPTNSEQILKMLAMYKKGINVFGNTIAFNKWLRKPAYGLDYEIPLDLLHTSGGIDLILDEISRIEYGDLS